MPTAGTTLAFVWGALMGNPIGVRVTPSFFPFALENLCLPSPDSVVRVTVGTAYGPRTDATRRALPIWNAFGHQRAVIICDPENMHQKRFTGNFKEKPKKKKKRQSQLCKHVKLLYKGVGVGGEVMDIKSKREDWKRRLPPSRRDIVSPLCR